MAGDWIKIENSTPNKPEVLKIARLMGITKDESLGKCIRFWVWLDQNCVDGIVDGVTSQDVDGVVDALGFCKCLKDVSWIDFDDESEKLTITNFDYHVSDSAKNRALKSKRQSRWRDNAQKSPLEQVDIVDARPSTGASTREEKRREEKSIKKNNKKSASENNYSEEFEQFWSVFPEKKSKKTAWKSWQQIDPDESLQKTIIQAVHNQINERAQIAKTGRKPQYWKNPSTWLNNDCWTDEVSQEASQSQEQDAMFEAWLNEGSNDYIEGEVINV